MTDTFSAPWRKFIPCACTVLALCAGVCSILASAQARFLLAARLVLVSLALDGFDGILARLLHGRSGFGGELDAFVDITGFGIAPAVLLYFHAGGLAEVPVWGLVVACLIVLSGAFRLSRCRVVDSCRGQRGYLGLPIAAAAAFSATYVIAIQNARHLPASWKPDWFSLGGGPLAICFWAALLLMLWLQVSRVRYGKPTKNPGMFIPFLVLLAALFIRPIAVYSAVVMSICTVWYAFVSPFFFRRFLSRLPPVEEDIPAMDGGKKGQKGNEP